MSTIASPRASISVRSPSSTRTSIDSSSRPAPSARRNRAALRDYYGLKAASKETETKISEESSRTELGPEEDETLTELDTPDFSAKIYVDNLLARESLKGVLKVEADLISQIRNLDSDRKSLVYDNYSKLLSATSTIRRMRGNMDPLAPTTHTLGPAIAHIAETAASLSSTVPDPPKISEGLGISVQLEGAQSDRDALEKARKQKQIVKWMLDAPRRLQELVDGEQEEEAEKDWEEVRSILDRWQAVPGVQDLRATCEAIMEDHSETD